MLSKSRLNHIINQFVSYDKNIELTFSSVVDDDRIFTFLKRHRLLLYNPNIILLNNPVGTKKLNMKKEFFLSRYRIFQYAINQELRNIMSIFRSMSIMSLPFKGAGLWGLIYPSFYYRASGDIDILVPEEEISDAINCLREAGFQHFKDDLSKETLDIFKYEAHHYCPLVKNVLLSKEIISQVLRNSDLKYSSFAGNILSEVNKHTNYMSLPVTVEIHRDIYRTSQLKQLSIKDFWSRFNLENDIDYIYAQIILCICCLERDAKRLHQRIMASDCGIFRYIDLHHLLNRLNDSLPQLFLIIEELQLTSVASLVLRRLIEILIDWKLKIPERYLCNSKNIEIWYTCYPLEKGPLLVTKDDFLDRILDPDIGRKQAMRIWDKIEAREKILLEHGLLFCSEKEYIFRDG